uniref:uncharacterized protein LOC105352842 n=1 Tax=Fragaria vesca subsp. vesca TaxID=101020 RepID=UPI0005C8F1B0|nr:PREDICTED: uncharacterized protein LOC105352842 [Fragaria vesca subsp. vesca]
MDDCTIFSTPCKSGLKLVKDEGVPLQTHEITQFRSLVGCLQYLTFTRPDITYAINSMCQFLHSPTQIHLYAAQRVLRYVKGTISQGIHFRRGVNASQHDSFPSSLNLSAFCDADWAGDPNDRNPLLDLSFCSINLQNLGAVRNKQLCLDLLQKLNTEAWLTLLLKSCGLNFCLMIFMFHFLMFQFFTSKRLNQVAVCHFQKSTCRPIHKRPMFSSTSSSLLQLDASYQSSI